MNVIKKAWMNERTIELVNECNKEWINEWLN